MNLSENSQFSLNIFLFRRRNWVLLELVRRRTQNSTKLDQEEQKIEQICFLPRDYRQLKHWFTSSAWNLCRWRAYVSPGETSQAARRDGCFRKLSGECGLIKSSVFIRISVEPRISAHIEKAPILKAKKFKKRPPPPHPTSHSNSNRGSRSPNIHPASCICLSGNWNWVINNKRVFCRVFYRSHALLHLRVLLLPFIVLLKKKHATLAENGENLISAHLE